jgi:hypothetical protein
VVGISINTLKTCRNRLDLSGLKQAETEAGTNVFMKFLGRIRLLVRYQNLTPYPYPYLQKTDDINKHKPDQTKPNNSFSGGGAPVEKKMVSQ